MQSYWRTVRTAVVLTAVAAAAAGCSSGGTGKASSPSSPGESPAQALAASVKTSQATNSFAATMDLQTTSGSGGMGTVNLSGKVSFERQPMVMTEVDMANVQAGGTSAGPMSVIETPSAIFLKMPMMSQVMHSTKPYLEIPMSELKNGGAMSALLNQAQSSNPLSIAQLLNGATDVKQVGTSTVNGVPVTEYQGTEPVSAAIAKLPANLRSSLGEQVQKAGFKQINFQASIDAQHNLRKMTANEVGTSVNETVTFTVTSINQPVQITMPSPSQVQKLPASAFNAPGM